MARISYMLFNNKHLNIYSKSKVSPVGNPICAVTMVVRLLPSSKLRSMRAGVSQSDQNK